MTADRRSHAARRLTYILGGVLGLCALALTLSALSNLGLPTHSRPLDRLAPADKALLAEAANLRASLGDVVWPGWKAHAFEPGV